MTKTNLPNRLIPVLFEDDNLLAVCKPAGVDAGGRQDEDTYGVVEILQALRSQRQPLVPINRLSRFESGVLLLAKNAATAEQLRGDLRKRQLAQTYLAISRGHMKKPRIVVQSSHGASRGKKEPDVRPARPSKTAVAAPQKTGARTTLSRVRESEKYTLVRCETDSQTTHALRAQLRAVDLPLIGDKRTGATRAPQFFEHTLLHLSEVSLRTRDKRDDRFIKAPPPREQHQLLEGKTDIDRLLRAAITRRLPLITSQTTNAIRLLTGPAEYMHGLIVEQFADVIILQVLDDRKEMQQALRPIASFYRELLGARAVYVKRFVKDRAAVDVDLRETLFSPKPLQGAPAAPQVEVNENGVLFAIRPYDGFSVGLFPDQRDNRKRIRELATGKEVLNLFAYTCGFSVSAAMGGAKATTSVDLAPKHLEWGKVNFKLNNLDPGAHEFVAADAMDYLSRAAKHERQFDIIVIDAPTFAHGRKAGKDFSIDRDLPTLTTAAAKVLRKGGTIMISTNNRKMSHRSMREKIKQGANRRRVEFTASPPLPLDYAIDPDHAKTVFARFD